MNGLTYADDLFNKLSKGCPTSSPSCKRARRATPGSPLPPRSNSRSRGAALQ